VTLITTWPVVRWLETEAVEKARTPADAVAVAVAGVLVTGALLVVEGAEAVGAVLVAGGVCTALVLAAEFVELGLPESPPHPLSAAPARRVADINSALKFCNCIDVTSYSSVQSNSAWVSLSAPTESI